MNKFLFYVKIKKLVNYIKANNIINKKAKDLAEEIDNNIKSLN